MDLHHKMVLALLQKPDDGSDKLLKVSRARADLTSLGTMVLIWDQRRIPGLHPLTTRSKDVRDLCTDNPFPEIMN